MRIMRIPSENAERIEFLRSLVDRLSAPDLTLSEAKGLREHLSKLLDEKDQEEEDPLPPVIATRHLSPVDCRRAASRIRA